MQKPPENVKFATKKRKSKAGDGTFKLFSVDFPTKPRSTWEIIDNSYLVRSIFDQLDGHCTSNAATGAQECLEYLAGIYTEQLSPESLYIQHSRWGTGSTLDENLKCLSTNGVLTRKTYPQSTTSHSIVPFNTWSEARKQEANRHRVLEWFDLDGDFDNLCTALQLGFICPIGLNWPGGGGHSVLATALTKTGNKWSVRGPNSWGADWNGDGYYSLTEANLSSLDNYGCWAGRACYVP